MESPQPETKPDKPFHYGAAIVGAEHPDGSIVTSIVLPEGLIVTTREFRDPAVAPTVTATRVKVDHSDLTRFYD